MSVILVVHVLASSALVVYGLHRVWMVASFLWLRNKKPLLPPSQRLPKVAIQLPIYNERGVVERLLNAACAMDYPSDCLEIQVLDDSTDDTSQLVAELVGLAREKGHRISHIQREGRAGYKAGALAYGTRQTDAELIAIFDADFIPEPTYLRQVVREFRDGIGMVQARWGHINRNENWLTRAQAVFLDSHFSIDHVVRSLRGHFFNFNGTAGVWRRSAIARGGGWDARTLTEDLDLSFRAHLNGVRFCYVDEVAVPAELPRDPAALKGQQHRWAKGSIQTAKRMLGPLWASPQLGLGQKIDASLKLTQNCAFLFLAILLCTMPLVSFDRVTASSPWLRFFDVAVFFLATLPVATHFFVASAARERKVREALLSIPLALGLGAALAINNSWAVLEGFLGSGHDEFVRTPKRGDAEAKTSYRTPLHIAVLVELFLGLWHIGTALYLAFTKEVWTIPFLLCFGVSMTALALQSIAESGMGALKRIRLGSHIS